MANSRPRQPNRDEAPSPGDRAVSGLLGGCFAFATMLIAWLAGLYLCAPLEPWSFSWTWAGTALGAGVGLLAGPERMMDGFQVTWRTLGRIWYVFSWRP